MYNKRAGVAKFLASTVKRFFHARNIIVVSDHKVDHVPLSATMQILLCIGILGFFSGGSYIVGSYMTARSAIQSRDERIALGLNENDRVESELALLKQDLVHLRKNDTKLNDYNKFIASQYDDKNTPQYKPSDMAALAGQSNSKLLERIAYLENRITKMKDETDHMMIAIRTRTDKKIDYLEDIISMTGLDSGRLEQIATEPSNKHTVLQQPPAADPADDSAGKQPQVHGENAGGPFIPYDESQLSESDRALLDNVDQVVLLNEIVGQLPLRQPLENGIPGSPFGRRIDPLNRRWAMHPGMDIVGPIGARVYSTSAGTVIAAEHRIAYGNMVDIDHGYGIVTRYAHMSKLLVKEGDVVQKGQLIGIQGSTGRSTGPHLHYEVRINDRPVNPAKFIRAGTYVLPN